MSVTDELRARALSSDRRALRQAYRTDGLIKLEKLLDAEALGRMKPSAHLVNVARGPVVDEAALVEALAERRIAGAGIDVTVEEPLAPNSPLWEIEQVLLTPHTAGETRRYEDNVIEILRDNLKRLRRGGALLRNQVI